MDENDPFLDPLEALRTILRRENSILGTVGFIARHIRPRPWVRYAFFFIHTGNSFTMVQITAPNINTAQTLAFGLVGNTPQGDTFVEPTVQVAPPSAGTVTLQPSVQGANGAFTTAGLFTPGAGFTGSVTLSADVQGVDNQDATFTVDAIPPETAAFDPAAFAVNPIAAAPQAAAA